MRLLIAAAAVLVITVPAFALDPPEEAHPQCWESLKSANSADRVALAKLADESTECQALPPPVVKFLISQAALLGSFAK